MKDKFLRITLALIISTLLSFTHSQSSKKDTLELPSYNKGTFWKLRYEQIITNHRTGQISDHITNHSCYINQETIYQGEKVYEMTFLKENEEAILGYFRKSNLGIFDFVKYRKNYDDTLTIRIQLLDFPLYKGKKWESIYKMQEHFGSRPITSFNVAHTVLYVKDTLLQVGDENIKTKSYGIKAEFSKKDKYSKVDKQYSSEYEYLAPSDNFPGSCPLFLFWLFDKNTVKLPISENPKYEITNSFNQVYTNCNW